MRLKDKFKLPIDANNNINDYVAKQCEQIADDFAIGFAEWLDNKYYQGNNVNEYHKSILEYREGKIFTVKELLEIFKKEKGL